MQKQVIEKEWYTKNEILELYPIGVSTYKRRIKRLDSSDYKFYTRMIKKELQSSNLKNIQVREIHRDIIDEIFGNTRLPNQGNINGVIKWVNNIQWTWFGNIIPTNTLAYELKDKMKFLFSRLKKVSGIDGRLVIFYCIEKNTNDDYYHSHLLIRDEKCLLDENIIRNNLELIAEENTSKETRIYLKKYDYKNYGKRGSSYTLKNMLFGYEILK
jgi:hypothetical protein